MPRQPVYHTILVVDVEGSSGRTDGEKPLLRETLYGTLMVAFARAGLLWDMCRREDRGDGVYLLVPAMVPKPALAGALVAAIDDVLAEIRTGDASWPRLRLSLHAGEVTFDADGSSGRDVDLAFGLADADEVRAALRADPGARCVLVVSDPFRAALAQGGHGVGWAADFEPVQISTKSGRQQAWLRVPTRSDEQPRPPASRRATVAGDTAPWHVLVGLPGGAPCGSGVLLPGQHVLTCTHLIPGGRQAPRGVAVTGSWDLPGTDRRAEVVAWSAAYGPPAVAAGPYGTGTGLAVLHVPSALPPGARPAPLARLRHAAPGRRLQVAGPVPRDVEIVAADALVRLRYLDRDTGGPGADGWSRYGAGAPVTDPDTGAVVGMLVEGRGWPVPNETTMVPIEAVTRDWPPLGELLGSGPGALPGQVARTDAAGRDTAPASLLTFALALADLGALETSADRDQVIAVLGLAHPDISAMVRRFSERRSDVVSLVRTCRRYEGGLDDLLAIVRKIEGDSAQMRQILILQSRVDDGTHAGDAP